MSYQLIIAPGVENEEPHIIAEALALQAEAINQAQSLKTVTDAFESSIATDSIKSLKDLKKQMTDAHAEVKAPFLTLTRRFDEIRRDYIDPIDIEISRLGKIQAAFELAERKKREEAEREARKKAEAERQAAIYEAEQRAKKEREGRTETLLHDQAEIIAKGEEKAAAALAEVANQHSAQKGVRIRKTLKFEIKDVSALQAARPDLFSPDDSKIRAAIKLTQSIPGLEIWEETSTY